MIECAIPNLCQKSIENPITMCQTAKPYSKPKLWLFLSLRQALYVACNTSNAAMPLESMTQFPGSVIAYYI